MRDGGRRVYQQVTLSEDEQTRLRARAEELAVSVPRLLVESALGDGVGSAGGGVERRRTLDSLFEIERLLATVANNVNQLARYANTTGELPAAAKLEGMRAEVLDLVRALREVTGARA
jgi:Bacterial mobilisation protein (MobC)